MIRTMITEKQYKKALAIIKEYRKQLSLSIVRERFSLDDLELLHGAIGVPSCTINNFSEDDCNRLDDLISEKIRGVEWCNVDDVGYLIVSFYRATKLNDEMIEVTLDCLNALLMPNNNYINK